MRNISSKIQWIKTPAFRIAGFVSNFNSSFVLGFIRNQSLNRNLEYASVFILRPTLYKPQTWLIWGIYKGKPLSPRWRRRHSMWPANHERWWRWSTRRWRRILEVHVVGTVSTAIRGAAATGFFFFFGFSLEHSWTGRCFIGRCAWRSMWSQTSVC